MRFGRSWHCGCLVLSIFVMGWNWGSVICRDLRTKGEGWKSSICDRSSAMRIMLIYERTVTKFKGHCDEIQR